MDRLSAIKIGSLGYILCLTENNAYVEISTFIKDNFDRIVSTEFSQLNWMEPSQTDNFLLLEDYVADGFERFLLEGKCVNDRSPCYDYEAELTLDGFVVFLSARDLQRDMCHVLQLDEFIEMMSKS